MIDGHPPFIRQAMSVPGDGKREPYRTDVASPMRRSIRDLVLGLAVVATTLAMIGTATSFGWVLALWLPTTGALLPLLPLRPKNARIARITSTVLISIFPVPGGFPVGMCFSFPGAIAMGISAALMYPAQRSASCV